jgi:geranylgeranylglycerol-phosphate geranylgeranyltransferase
MPALFVSMCTFLLNDLDDIDKDRINHPDRPLPRGDIAPVVVVVVYFACLAAALFSIGYSKAPPPAAFLYYILLTTAISYGYVVDYIPSIKALYVASASVLPVAIVYTIFPRETALLFTAAAAFAFVLGRELCKDILDRPGDPTSRLQRVSPTHVAQTAIALQMTAVFIVTFAVRSLWDLVVAAAAAALVGYSRHAWFCEHKYRRALLTMKLALFSGLYFLCTVR